MSRHSSPLLISALLSLVFATSGCITTFDADGVALEEEADLMRLTGPTTISRSALLSEADAQWARLDNECSANDGPGDNEYRAFVVVNGSETELTIDVEAVLTFTGFLHAFSTPWNPADGAGCLFGEHNTDAPGHLTLPTMGLAPRESKVLVVSNNDPDASGTFTVTITAKAAP